MQSAIHSYRNLHPLKIRVVLVHGGAHLLPELGEPLGRYTEKKLRERGIEVLTQRRLRSITDSGVTLDDGLFIGTSFVVWAAGNSPSPVVAGLPFANRAGRIDTNPMLQVERKEGVWALGDCASIPDGNGGFHPPTAQHALRQARTAARNLVASIRGEALRPFSFRTIGQAEALGQQTLERQRWVIGSNDPDTLATEENLAELYRLEGRFRLSESIATKALETERRVPGPASRAMAEMLLLLGMDYTAQGRYSEAEDLFRQYSQGSSPNPEVDRAFAWFLLTAPNPGRRDPARALALARRALVSEPDNPDRLKTLGLAEVRNGLWGEAIATLRKAAALHGERDPDDYLFLAQAYQGRGDATNAGSNYERAVTLLGDVATADSDDVPLWRETAAALGKPAPSSSKKSASKSAGTR